MPTCALSSPPNETTGQPQLERFQGWGSISDLWEHGRVKPSVLAGLPFVAILAWVIALMVDPGIYGSISMALIGSGLLIGATVGTVGLVTMGARWARWTLVAGVATTFAIAIGRPVDGLWIVAISLGMMSLVYLLSPGRGAIRKLPSASGPPPRAVLVTMLCLLAPLGLGLAPIDANGWVAVVAIAGPLTALWYTRVVAGGLFAMRYGFPALALALAPLMGVAHATLSVALAVAIGVLARSADVAVAFRPLVKGGTAYPIPPELAPKEILEEAGIDDKGRRL